MCGIIAVLRRRSRRPAPSPDDVRADLDAALAMLPEIARDLADPGVLGQAADRLENVGRMLWGPPGIDTLLHDASLADEVAGAVTTMRGRVGRLETALDAGELQNVGCLEALNAALVRLKDVLWTILRDRLRAAREVAAMAGPSPGRAAIEAFASLQTALSSLDRLEVRGRDSAGLQVLVTGHGLDLDSPQWEAVIAARSADPLFTSRAVRARSGALSFVYKAAAEIGELGDNGRELRAAIAGDDLLRAALAADTAEAVVLGHTRWASIGIISQPNAHPLNQEEVGRDDGPYVVAALNGDVDNYQELRIREQIEAAPEITTDAKVIPVMVSRRLEAGVDFGEAFRQTVSSFIGSVAIGAAAAPAPDRIALALRGSGQALYVGICEDSYVVASEPYGVVEETSTYLRLDGETPGNPDNPSASQGQIVVLSRDGAGSVEGLTRIAYDGTPLPVTMDEMHHAEITTRDIDRGDYPHYLLKEISESPRSFRKTLRGKIVDGSDGVPHVQLDGTIPDAVAARLTDGSIRRVLVIGQGTAAVAGQGVASLMAEVLAPTHLDVLAMPATELSGFRMREDMSDTLIVAISQSGTTTDTNRTVDLVRSRGAAAIGIVNRRNSDLCDKADGVLYTSDGRDVEMSVASTKAFYAQIAAGSLLAFALAETVGGGDERLRRELIDALRALPAAMERTLLLREHIAAAARAHAPRRRYWAVVGNGNNRIAAQEIRIKLSELCYKSIACDATEDKKHIDLSAEPLILVCAAGLRGSNADDVSKEVAIYAAHKAAPIVIATEGEGRFTAALDVIGVPSVHRALDFVLAAVAGHLFGYEAALAIDAEALPLREMRTALERVAPGLAGQDDIDVMRAFGREIMDSAGKFFGALRDGSYDGQMEASTASRLASLLRYALGTTPIEMFSIEHGRPGSPAAVFEELADALTRGIEELTRPVDAIKHQAKTVTVGISRSDEELLGVPLIKELMAAGVPRDNLGYRDLRTLAALDPAVDEVLGYTRYGIDGDVSNGATIHVLGQGGVATSMRSRTAEDPRLRGTKHQVAGERQVFIATGASDQRLVVFVPEVRDGQAVGLILLHVQFKDTVSASAMRGVLRGYRNRYDVLRDAVMETEPSFREELLGEVSVTELMTAPIVTLVRRWRDA